MLEQIFDKNGWRGFVVVIISAFAVIAIWRGAWNLMDEFLLVNNFVWSQLVTITFGVAILLIIANIRWRRMK